MQPKQQSATRSAIFLAILGIISQLCAFCYRVALSRMVGAEIMGLYQLIMPVYSVITALTAVGVTGAVSNLTAQYLAVGNRRGADQIHNFALRVFVLMLLPVSVFVVVFSDPISVYLLGDARTQLGLMLLLPCVLLTGIENINKHFFYGAGEVKAPAVAELVEQVIRATAVLGLLVLLPRSYPERTTATIVLGMVLCEVFSAVILCTLYHRWLGRNPLTGAGETSRALRGRVASVAVPMGLSSLLGNLIGMANATLLPSKLVEGGLTRTEAMSQFGVVCGMILPMLALPTVILGALNLVLIPRLAQATALQKKASIRHYVRRALMAVSISMLPAMGVLAVIGGTLGEMLFGKTGAIGAYLLPLSMAMALSCFHVTFSAILNGVSHQKSAAFISLLCGVIQLVITVIAVPEYHMGGYVFGVLFASVVGAVASGVWMFRVTGAWGEWFSWLFAPALTTLLMALCGNLLYQYLQNGAVSSIMACGMTTIFCVILYIAGLHAQGLSLVHIFRYGGNE